LDRPISLRTAICDYFCSIHKSLKNPKVVEIHIFEKAVKASRFDSLTGLYNRQYFDESLKREIHRAKRHNQNLTVLFFDLDDFKRINDSYGHQAGDRVLERMAKIILGEKRSEDIAARYGGEEMVLILPETDPLEALVLAERIRERVAESVITFRGSKMRLTISGGLAAFPINATTADALLKCADRALYRAKGAGKNNIALFSEDRRRYLRIDLDRSVRVRELDFNGSGQPGCRTKNICAGGILFENPYPIPIGTRVQVNMPAGKKSPLVIIGSVVRLEQFAPDRYDIGVSISLFEMDKSVKQEVARWLQLQRSKTPPG
jgi:diguanylate cyclase (GGDEF)-like protein